MHKKPDRPTVDSGRRAALPNGLTGRIDQHFPMLLLLFVFRVFLSHFFFFLLIVLTKVRVRSGRHLNAKIENVVVVVYDLLEKV